jgi:hypothetical protein
VTLDNYAQQDLRQLAAEAFRERDRLRDEAMRLRISLQTIERMTWNSGYSKKEIGDFAKASLEPRPSESEGEEG